MSFGVGLLLLAAGPAGARGSAPGTPSFPSAGASARLSLHVEAPALDAGNATNVSVAWSATTGCPVVPLWSQVFPAPGVTGLRVAWFDNGTGRVVAATTPGAQVLDARGAALVECPGSVSTAFAAASANLSVVLPLGVSGVEVGPAPVLPGGSTNVSGVVSGGFPPFQASVRWGDGSGTSVSLPGDGAFSIPHSFPNGTFRSTVFVQDARGALVTGSAPVPVEVGAQGVLGMNASLPLADVGVPVEFHGRVFPPLAMAFGDLSCPGAAAKGLSPSVVCLPSAPGFLSVNLTFYPAEPGPNGSLCWQEPVAAVPQLSVPASAFGVDGSPSLIPVIVAGGVPPFTLSADAPGPYGLGAPIPDPADGLREVAVAPAPGGPENITFHLTDALGVAAPPAVTELFPESELTTNLSVGSEVANGSATVRAVANVSGGAPPLCWAFLLVPSAPGNGSALPGGCGGPPHWSVDLATEGTAQITLVLCDAQGNLATGTEAVGLVATPQLSVGVVEDPPRGGFELSFGLAGGVPPFDIVAEVSGRTVWNATLSEDGLFSEFVAYANASPRELSVELRDHVGGIAEENVTLGAEPPSDPPEAAPDLSWLYLAATLGGGGAIVVVWRRRRRISPEPVPTTDPRSTLHGILSPLDGAERTTVELLAEEAGVPLETVRETLDRLIEEGTVRAETTAEGEQILAWPEES